MPLLSSPPTLNYDIKGNDMPSAIPSNLFPASCRHIHNCLYIWCKCTKASGHVAQLKPSCKASIMSKCRGLFPSSLHISSSRQQVSHYLAQDARYPCYLPSQPSNTCIQHEGRGILG